MKEWFMCNFCNAFIYVEQDHYNDIKYPCICHENQGGCGKTRPGFVRIEKPLELIEYRLSKITKDIKETKNQKEKEKKKVSTVKHWNRFKVGNVPMMK